MLIVALVGGGLVPAKTQFGVWLCHTSVCPTTYMLLLRPKFTKASAGPNSQPVRAFVPMDDLPLEIVLRRHLVELFLDENNVSRALLRAPAKARAARDHVAVDRRPDETIFLEGV